MSDPDPSQGLHAKRLAYSDCLSTRMENAFAEAWAKEEERGTLALLFQVDCKKEDPGATWIGDSSLMEMGRYIQRPLGRVTDRDRIVAKTLMQWLGTNVGRGFVVGVIERFISVRYRERPMSEYPGLQEVTGGQSRTKDDLPGVCPDCCRSAIAAGVAREGPLCQVCRDPMWRKTEETRPEAGADGLRDVLGDTPGGRDSVARPGASLLNPVGVLESAPAAVVVDGQVEGDRGAGIKNGGTPP